MNIRSSDEQSWIELVRFEDQHSYSAFKIDCELDLGHSRFSASNSDVHLFHFTDFVSNLDSFIMDRTIEPILEGTYDTYLKFVSQNREVFIMFQIGSAGSGCEAEQPRLSGSFSIEQEMLLSLLTDFKRLA